VTPDGVVGAVPVELPPAVDELPHGPGRNATFPTVAGDRVGPTDSGEPSFEIGDVGGAEHGLEVVDSWGQLGLIIVHVVDSTTH
jgi:hypothetical protein